MSQKIYDLITDRIIALLEAGVIPWRKRLCRNQWPMKRHRVEQEDCRVIQPH